MESLKFVKGFTRIRKVRAFFIQGRDLKRATDFERSKSGFLKRVKIVLIPLHLLTSRFLRFTLK